MLENSQTIPNVVFRGFCTLNFISPAQTKNLKSKTVLRAGKELSGTENGQIRVTKTAKLIVVLTSQS